MSQNVCDTIGPLLSAFVDGEADNVERRSVEEHVAICPTCAADLGFLQTMHRAPGTPAWVTPPSDLAAIVARATYARPTLASRLAALLQPAPVRLGLAGAFVAVCGIAVLRVPTGVPVTVDPGVGAVKVVVPHPPAPVETATDSNMDRVAPVALVKGSGIGKPVAARVASRTPAPVSTIAHAAVPNAIVRRVAFSPSGSEPVVRIVPATAPPRAASLTRRPDDAIRIETEVATRVVAPTVSESVPTPSPIPAPPTQIARAATGSHELAIAEDETDARAAYEAGLQAQSESSRRKLVGNAIDDRGDRSLLSVVRAPVTTTNR